jgi:hypothetical protein
VDWYEAYADLAGERTKLQVFSMRSMASGAAFHCAFSNATQQAFLEAHELAFAWFGGVFHRLRYVFVVDASFWQGQANRDFSQPGDKHDAKIAGATFDDFNINVIFRSRADRR